VVKLPPLSSADADGLAQFLPDVWKKEDAAEPMVDD
jgi:hypothetical protein